MTVLAKKGNANNPNAQVTLWTHTQDVWESSRALFGQTEPTALAAAWFRFFKVPLDRWAEFRKLLDLACLWHDTGKATCSFQGMLKERIDQVIRHEYLSLLLLREAMKTSPALKESIYPLLHTVVAHHLKSGDKYYLDLALHDAPITVYAEDEGLRRILTETAGVLDEPVEPVIPCRLDGKDATSQETWTKLFDKRYRKKADADPNFFRALALALVTSDAAGSALRRTGLPISEWISRCFPNERLAPEALQNSIIRGRIGDIERRNGKSYSPNSLQVRAQNLPARAVLVSPCGSGKTLAAYLWAEKQLAHHQARRIIFLYPTRNTATEGFRDYVSWGEDDAGLMHGTSDFDLKGITFNGDEPEDDNKDKRNQANFRTEDALYALGYWNKRYISATVDSFLSFTANRYAADCMLPLLCDSILVVDEVHALDQRMFRHLGEFLSRCDLPTLMMTATLPPIRRQAIDKLGITVDDGGEEAQREASLPRYDVELVDDTSMTKQIRAWLQGPELRLLIVHNQVKTCQETAREVQDLIEELAPGTQLLVYHSRFKLADRKKRHEEVIEKFKGVAGRVVLVSTQVCQMSLDLDAEKMSLDLDAESLFTELAPFPDLVQRMGRANRHGHFDRASILVFKNAKTKPYEPFDLEEAGKLLRQLPRPQDTSQWDLAMLMNRADEREVADQQAVPLFDSLPKLESQPYRDIQEFTVDCVLDCDLAEYLRLQEARCSSAAGLVVPVPRFEKPTENFKLPRYLRVADGDKYCPSFGYGGHDE